MYLYVQAELKLGEKIRGKLYDEGKHVRFNQPWSAEEQVKTETE